MTDIEVLTAKGAPIHGAPKFATVREAIAWAEEHVSDWPGMTIQKVRRVEWREIVWRDGIHDDARAA